MAPAIEAVGLVKRFDTTPAVQNVTLRVPRGSVMGLAGPNGAGKSTLMGMLAGALTPDAGEVLICGQPVKDNPQAKEMIAWIPGEPFFFPSEDVDGMARFYASTHPRFSRERFEALASCFNLDRTRKLRKLSKGMRRQAAFWLSLSLEADVLILDEPMDGLDPLVRRRMWQLVLGEVAERDLTVLASTHNLRELEGVCDRLAIMDGGALHRQLDVSGGDASLVKVQVILPEGATAPRDVHVEHASSNGRLQTFIVRGSAREVRASFMATSPSYLELVPLTLEETFLYDLGDDENDLRNIIL